MGTPSISREEYAVYVKLIRDCTGIALDDSKTYLIESRLAPLLTEHKCASYSELYYKIKNDASGGLRKQIINKMTTQETSFFRDQAPFEMLKFKLVPDLIDARQRLYPQAKRLPIRIWSAACSTGQEVYSIIISLKEVLGDLSKYSLQVLGTDISDSAVTKASYGIYSKFEIERGMPPDRIQKYFERRGEEYKISDEIRAYATFRQFNLFDDFASLGRWDIIFCRNVAIYFTEADKKRLFQRFRGNLERDGSLIIGSTESLLGICPEFESQRYLRSVFYRAKPS